MRSCSLVPGLGGVTASAGVAIADDPIPRRRDAQDARARAAVQAVGAASQRLRGAP